MSYWDCQILGVFWSLIVLAQHPSLWYYHVPGTVSINIKYWPITEKPSRVKIPRYMHLVLTWLRMRRRASCQSPTSLLAPGSLLPYTTAPRLFKVRFLPGFHEVPQMWQYIYRNPQIFATLMTLLSSAHTSKYANSCIPVSDIFWSYLTLATRHLKFQDVTLLALRDCWVPCYLMAAIC